MDRAEFLIMAQRVAVYTKKCKDLSKPLIDDCIVIHNEIKYYPQSVQVGYDETGNVENVAILHDLKRNSVTYANLERVKKYEPSRDYLGD